MQRVPRDGTQIRTIPDGRLARVYCKAAHFLRHQLAVRALALHQAIRRTVFDDLARFQHHHPVEIAQRGEAMRDRDHGAPAHQAAERLADRLLGFAVERGGGLVEQQDRRILQERARNGNALALAAR